MDALLNANVVAAGAEDGASINIGRSALTAKSVHMWQSERAEVQSLGEVG
jgi:hypothetical protein